MRIIILSLFTLSPVHLVILKSEVFLLQYMSPDLCK